MKKIYILLCLFLTLTAGAMAQAYAPIAPLLGETSREDFGIFNDSCPYYRSADGTLSDDRTAVGCVAQSAEQLLSYYQRVITLQDTLKGWTTPHYTIPDVLPGTTIDCGLILPRYTEGSYTTAQAEAVQRLGYYMGVAAKMKWNTGASGTSVRRLVKPLKEAFGLKYVHHVERCNYSPETWREMLVSELRAGRPVLYAGYTHEITGHAWVIDGMDEKGNFHCRWGNVGNSYDGYFSLDHLLYSEPYYDQTPQGDVGGFFTLHEMLFLHPDSIAGNLPEAVARTGREVVIDSLVLVKTPQTNVLTPAKMYVRNVSDAALNVTYEIFTNHPADTALFAQADWVGLTAVTLEAGERKCVDVYLRFDSIGNRILRLTPDEEVMAYEIPVAVTAGTAQGVTLGAATLRQTGEDEVTVFLPVSNRGATRTGMAIYPEVTDTHKDGVRHPRYYFLEPGEERVDTLVFRGLQADSAYEFLARNPWAIEQRIPFTVHATTGIRRLAPQASGADAYYDLRGCRVAVPERGKIYVRRGRKIIYR